MSEVYKKLVEDIPQEFEELLERARLVRLNAYAPYSNFHVGAAVRTIDGNIFTGCNVENASYGATICAERVAISAAVAAGYKTFTQIAIIGDFNDPLPPCGICRQVMGEFSHNATVLMTNLKGETIVSSVDELLPLAFNLSLRADQII
jgi:cytidine deaminase